MLQSGLYSFLSVIIFGLLYIFTATGVLIVIFLSWLNARRAVKFLTKVWASAIFMIMFKKLHVSGKEKINKNKRYIVTANHASLFDIVAIAAVYPGVSWFGHERLLKVPVFGKFLRMTDYVPFREPTVSNTRHMLEQLIQKANNQSVALFPEGTRTTDGKIHPFYRGFIYLMKSREIDVLPVTLNGFYNFKPKTRFYIDFRSRLEVIIHEPIPRAELINKADKEILDIVKNRIESGYR